MQTVLLVALLLSTPQAPAVQTAAPVEPPATSEAIVLDPLEGAVLAHHCSVAFTQCANGGSISCVGHTSCSSGTGWVKCDGVQTYCQVAQPCFKVCMDGYTSCSGDYSCSGSGVHSITCDGQTYECGPPIG
jgi:hypothetical protein